MFENKGGFDILKKTEKSGVRAWKIFSSSLHLKLWQQTIHLLMQVAIFFAIDNTGWPTTHHLQIACVFSGTADDSKNFPQVKD